MRIAYWGAVASLLALIALSIAWELWLAPLRGVLAGRRRTYQWSSMLILAYLAEGSARAWSDLGLSAALALVEVILALVYFGCALTYARLGAARS